MIFKILMLGKIFYIAFNLTCYIKILENPHNFYQCGTVQSLYMVMKSHGIALQRCFGWVFF